MRNLDIFSTKGITNSHHKCYMNASLRLSIGSSVNSFLPTILENLSVLNKCLQSIKEHFHKESTYLHNFLQKDSKNPIAKGSVMT